MSEIIAGALCITGSLFVLVGALALLRFPDVYCRISGSSLAVTMGLGAFLLSLVISDPSRKTVLLVVLIGLFLVITVPLSAHVVGRVAYSRGTPLTKITRSDALADTELGKERERDD